MGGRRVTNSAATERVTLLEEFESDLLHWQETGDPATRSRINRRIVAVRREVVEARCLRTVTIGPPPAIGGFVMRNADPFDLMLDPPYGIDLITMVVDMVEQTIGVLKSGPHPVEESAVVEVDQDVQPGYVFVAMPMDDDDPSLVDVLDAIKEGAKRCGLTAERVDEPPSNDRITDRILESIRKAEYVVADLTDCRPNVFYEAGFAQGLGKTPVYVARKGTPLEFDLKDYPVIFFENMKSLKDGIEKRLRGLAEGRVT
jgi:transcription antitermination factor NusG